MGRCYKGVTVVTYDCNKIIYCDHYIHAHSVALLKYAVNFYLVENFGRKYFAALAIGVCLMVLLIHSQHELTGQPRAEFSTLGSTVCTP